MSDLAYTDQQQQPFSKSGQPNYRVAADTTMSLTDTGVGSLPKFSMPNVGR